MGRKPKSTIQSQILNRFIRSEPQKQIFARVPKSLHDRFQAIVNKEGISIYQAVEIACKLFIDYCEMPELRDYYDKVKKEKPKEKP